MASRLELIGLDDLRAALRRLPAELTTEATREMVGAANGAAADIKRAYPVHEGKLRDGIQVEQVSGQFSGGAIVKNTAPHAFIFENGTQVRRNARGQNRGAMPPGRVFVPRAIRHRRLMYERLKDLITRKGFQVTGDAR